MSELIYPDESGKIMGAGFEVSNTKGGRLLKQVKVVAKLVDGHVAQVLKHLNATGDELGRLINSGHPAKLESKRIVRPKR